MKLLFIDQFGGSKLVESPILPRSGDKVDMFYRPFPKVLSVLLYPQNTTLEEMKAPVDIDAIITVS